MNTGVTKPEPTIVIEEVSEDKEEKIRQTDQAEVASDREGMRAVSEKHATSPSTPADLDPSAENESLEVPQQLACNR